MADKRKRWGKHPTEAGIYAAITVGALALSALLTALTVVGDKNTAVQAPAVQDYSEQAVLTAPPQSQNSAPLPAPEPISTPAPADPREYTVTLTDEQVSSLAMLALREYAESVSAHFAAPDILEVAAELKRESVLAYLADEHELAAAAARAVLPDTFEARVSAQISAEDGALRVRLGEAAALGVNITQYIPAGVEGKLNDAIREALPDSANLTAVRIYDGGAEFTLKV